jgi:hypothetical protein
MALNKFDVLGLGRGTLSDNANTAILFTSNNLVNNWDTGATYAQYNVVEYSGRIYRSKINSNLAFQPDINPNSWETLYVGPKDGDVNFVVNGGNSTILQRLGGIWSSLAAQEVSLSLSLPLVDGQVAATTAFLFLGSANAFANVRYTVRRGTGYGRERRGTFNILNDTISNIAYDHEFSEIGADVNVPLSWDIVGGNVRLRYTSAAESVPIQLTYMLEGWI